MKQASKLCIDTIGSYDVICGRNKNSFNNIGNRRFRVTIALALHRYHACQTRPEKTGVVRSIVEQVRSNNGRFLKWHEQQWVELTDKEALAKVGHAVRDMTKAKGISKKSSRRSITLKLSRISSASKVLKEVIPLPKRHSEPVMATQATNSRDPSITTTIKARRLSVPSSIWRKSYPDIFESSSARGSMFIADEFPW